jgi:6-phosphogluconolactonase (cycloisomerase 2 family)
VGLSLVGCDGFFVKETTGTGTTTGGTTGSYAYVSNNATNTSLLSIYALSAGTLTSSSTFSLGYAPSSLAIVPGNTYLYAANPASLAIFAYSIGSTGSLATANSGSAVALSIDAVSMDISPDGKWLFALNGIQQSLSEYQTNSSNGTLTLVATINYVAANGLTVLPSSIRVAPSGGFVVASLGTGGDLIFPFTTSTGALGSYVSLSPPTASEGDYSAALDANNFLYVARTTGLAVYSLSTTGVGTLVSGSPFATGNASRSVLLSSSSAYVYTANLTDATISGFSIGASGALTALSGSPYASVPSVSVLGRDNSGKYILAGGYDSSAGLKLYTIGTGGVLSAGGSVATGTSTSVPMVMALTH